MRSSPAKLPFDHAFQGKLREANLGTFEVAKELKDLANSTDSKDAEKAGELLRAIAKEASAAEVMRTAWERADARY